MNKPVVLFQKDNSKNENTFVMLCEEGTKIDLYYFSFDKDLSGATCKPPVNSPFYLTMSDEDFNRHMEKNEQIQWVAL